MAPLRNNKRFLDLICSFKFGYFNAIPEASKILRICLFSGAASKTFHDTCDISFLSCVLQVQNLQRYCHVLPITILRLRPVSPMYLCPLCFISSILYCYFIVYNLLKSRYVFVNLAVLLKTPILKDIDERWLLYTRYWSLFKINTANFINFLI